MLSNEDRIFLLRVAAGDASRQAYSLGTPSPADSLMIAAWTILESEVARLAKLVDEPAAFLHVASLAPDPAYDRYRNAKADEAEANAAYARAAAAEMTTFAGEIAKLQEATRKMNDMMANRISA